MVAWQRLIPKKDDARSWEEAVPQYKSVVILF